jgi:hypothetical protein
MKTPTSTKKRFQFNAIVNQVLKLFAPSNQTQTQAEPQKTQKTPHHCMYSFCYSYKYCFYLKCLVFDLPSISVTSPEGQTTAVE